MRRILDALVQAGAELEARGFGRDRSLEQLRGALHALIQAT